MENPVFEHDDGDQVIKNNLKKSVSKIKTPLQQNKKWNYSYIRQVYIFSILISI